MNWIDKTISYFAPRWALQRARSRVAGTAVQLAYEGAKTGRRTSGWLSGGNSANAEIGPDLKKLRERSRELIRNNHFAAKLALEFATKSVGAGITVRTPAERLMQLWTAWQRECSADGLPHFSAVQYLVGRTVFESGECLVRRRTRTASVAKGMSVPIQIQVMEPDFLDSDKTGTFEGGYIIQGIEFNDWGQRVAYWMFPQHPGEITLATRKLSMASVRVPASEVLHVYEQTRPGQVRGVPHLAPVMLAMRDLDDWEDAELIRKKTEACLAAFITSSEDVALGAQTTESTTAKLLETFEPGMIARLRTGEDVKFNSPQYAGGYVDYKRSRVRDLAVGAGSLYEILAGDLSQVNYSSYRAGLLGYRDRIESVQYNLLIPMLCEPIWNWFVSAALDFGGLPEGEYPAEWTPPAFDLLDRSEESKADSQMLLNGTMTWPQAVSRQGYDPEKQITEIQTWKSRLDAAGVQFTEKAGGANGGQDQTANPAA